MLLLKTIITSNIYVRQRYTNTDGTHVITTHHAVDLKCNAPYKKKIKVYVSELLGHFLGHPTELSQKGIPPRI